MTIQFNAELAEQVLDLIRLNPDGWNQSVKRGVRLLSAREERA